MVVVKCHNNLWTPIFQAIHNLYQAPEESQAKYILTKYPNPKQKAIDAIWNFQFFSLYSILTHLTNLCPEEHDGAAFIPAKYLTKKVEQNLVEVIADEEKPFIIQYDKPKKSLKVTGHFQVTNKNGYVCI